MNLKNLSPEDRQIVIHASALVDRGIGMIEAYLHEHELEKSLGQEGLEKLIAATYVGLFMIYLRQIFMAKGLKETELFIDALKTESILMFQEGRLEG